MRSKKVLRVGNMVRDLLMKQPATIVHNKKIHYYGETYSFTPYKKKDVVTMFNKVKALFKSL